MQIRTADNHAANCRVHQIFCAQRGHKEELIFEQSVSGQGLSHPIFLTKTWILNVLFNEQDGFVHYVFIFVMRGSFVCSFSSVCFAFLRK